jgi:hypothetical protein
MHVIVQPLDTEPKQAQRADSLETPSQSAQESLTTQLTWDPFECPQFALARKELTMPITFFVDEICPKCSKPIKIAVIERHPSRPDLAVHNFECADCGPVRAKLISLKPGKQPEQAAA